MIVFLIIVSYARLVHKHVSHRPLDGMRWQNYDRHHSVSIILSDINESWTIKMMDTYNKIITKDLIFLRENQSHWLMHTDIFVIMYNDINNINNNLFILKAAHMKIFWLSLRRTLKRKTLEETHLSRSLNPGRADESQTELVLPENTQRWRQK